MAKVKQKAQEIEVLTLPYKLAELPSSQHRAGLAGLALIYRWLQRDSEFQKRLENGAICKVTENAEGATLEVNQLGLSILFDEIYAASAEEQPRNQLLKNSRTKAVIEPLRQEEIEETDTKGKTKKKTVYIYPVVVPRGSFLTDGSYDKSSNGKDGLWIKLWRDVVWSILRGVPTTRKPYEARADGEYSEDAIKIWSELVQPETFTVDLPSTYFLGAQAANAENVPFKDRARHQFLLHFWLFAAQIYVPQIIKIDRGKEARESGEKREFVGYAIAIPDVANLKKFCTRYLNLLPERGIEKSGYRPRDSVVDLPVESALDLMQRLTEITGEQSTSRVVLGIDVIHAEKQGNNVRFLAFQRIDPDEPTIDRYAQIKKSYWNPLFRRQRLINLVENKPWYMGFDALLCTIPYEQSMENSYFKHDAKIAFDTETIIMDESKQNKQPREIDRLIFDLIRNYVGRKLNNKYDLKWSDELKQNEEGKKKYEETKEKVAKDAFLAVRSRTENLDFINYFTSTLCSVPQYLQPDEYALLTKALYVETDRIRTLTLLALSANS